MKSNYNSKPRKKHIFKTEYLRQLNGYFSESFERWLMMSGWTEKEFLLRCSNTILFEIKKTDNRGEIRVQMYFDGTEVGQPIISSPDEAQNVYFNENTAFLLMHIAEKLDKINGGNCFCNVVREFAKTELRL